MKSTIVPILLLLVTDLGTNNPTTVTWNSPTDGSTISNTVTLSVNAGSTAGDIVRVEFYLDPGTPTQKLIGTWYKMIPVSGLNVKSMSVGK